MSDPATDQWERRRERPTSRSGLPPWSVAIRRGLVGRCPVCGEARLFRSFVSVCRTCPVCLTPLGDVPADDAPPYLTIFLSAHPLILLVLLLVRDTALGTASIFLLSLPVAAVLPFALLRPIKGALIGILLELDIWREDEPPPPDRDRSVRAAGPNGRLDGSHLDAVHLARADAEEREGARRP